jgi:hypothetical protein
VLSPSDDGVHERPPGAPDTWQENCFVLARDDEHDLCIYLHVERLADRVEVKAAVDAGGLTTWHDAHDDWWYEPDAPFESLRIAWKGGPIALDLSLSSHLPPIDHADVLAALGLPGAERDHYESVGVLSGTVAIDGGTLPVNGTFVRDHTWGVREYQRFGASWWWPTCFDGGDAYAGGVAVDLGGRTVGYGLVADADGVSAAADVFVDVTGDASPGGYDGTVIRFTPEGRSPVELSSRTLRHLCTTFPAFGPDRRWNDAYSHCTWGRRTGFGTRELGT